MKRIKILFILLAFLQLCGCEKGGYGPSSAPGKDKVNNPITDTEDPENPSDEVTERIIVGYATYWDTAIPDPTLMTHLNYAFAHIKNDFETLDIKQKSTRFKKILALKEKNPDLKIMLSVGGWGAGNFSEMAADETHRKNFCKNCAQAVADYGLAGIDLDWEYPTSSSAGISSSPQDTKNFNLLLKDMREAIGEDKLLTMASSSSAKYVDFKTAMQYLDFVNIMTYDMGKPPQHNSGLYKSSMTRRSCDESVTFHRQAGVPLNKIVLGMPFYGYGNGKEFSSETVDFNQIKIGDYTRKWDSQAKVPYLVNSSGDMILTYDDEESIGLKADYVISKGLLGAMYWNIEADDKNWTLSKAIASRLLKQEE